MLGIPAETTPTIALLSAIGAVVLAFVYQQSSYGLRLRASREDDRAAKSLGINVPLERAIAFVLSAFVVGMAGSLYAHFITSFTPDAFYLRLTFLTVAMLVIGGMHSLAGAVTGVVFVTAAAEFLRRVEVDGLGPLEPGALPGLTDVILALVLLATLIVRPDGITGGREFSLPRRRRPMINSGRCRLGLRTRLRKRVMNRRAQQRPTATAGARNAAGAKPTSEHAGHGADVPEVTANDQEAT